MATAPSLGPIAVQSSSAKTEPSKVPTGGTSIDGIKSASIWKDNTSVPGPGAGAASESASESDALPVQPTSNVSATTRGGKELRMYTCARVS